MDGKWTCQLLWSHQKFNPNFAAECGGRIHAATSGRILSPGYPAPYDNNLHCTWIIEADPGKTIRYMPNFNIYG